MLSGPRFSNERICYFSVLTSLQFWPLVEQNKTFGDVISEIYEDAMDDFLQFFHIL